MSALVIKTSVDNCITYENGAIRIDNVVLSYPHLDERWSSPDPKTGVKPPPKYSLVALMPKETHGEAAKLIEKAIKELIAAKAGFIAGKKDWFMRDGEQTGKPGYDDKWTVNAGEDGEVAIRDKKGNVLRDAKGNEFVEKADIARMFYPGAIVSVLLRPWRQDNSFGKKINAGLVAVKFMDDGERLGTERMDDSGAWDDAKPAPAVSKASATTALDDDDDEM